MSSKLKYIQKIVVKTIFKIVPNMGSLVYLNFHPDSYREFGMFREYRFLYKGWIKKSAGNNKGDLNRLWFFILNCEDVLQKSGGDLVEVGVYKGNSSYVLAHYARKFNRHLFLFDTFAGFDSRDLSDIDGNKKIEFTDNSLNTVKSFLGSDGITFEVGYFPHTFNKERHKRRYAVCSFDVDLYEPMVNCLRIFWPMLEVGGVMFIHDYSSGHWDGAKKAVDEFCLEKKVFVVLMPDKSGSAVIRKVSN